MSNPGDHYPPLRHDPALRGMIYSRALLLVRVLQRRVLVLINKSTFGKDDGEGVEDVASERQQVCGGSQQVHVMTLGGGAGSSRLAPLFSGVLASR